MPATLKTAHTAAEAARDAAQPGLEEVTAELATLRADMSRLVDTIAAVGRTKGEDAAHSLAAAAQDLGARGTETLAAAREGGAAALDRATGYLRERPAEALAIATALGFVTGLLLRRR